MSGKERRISPRKDCALPVRFRVLINAVNAAPFVEPVIENDVSDTVARPVPLATRGIMEGEVINRSERGIYFRSKDRVSIGAALEMYFTLPRELTGRTPEEIRCSARVVHIKHSLDHGGLAGIGATVERFEPMGVRNWHH